MFSWLIVLFAVMSAAVASGASAEVRFERRVLTDLYYCDGIGAGDFDRDGHMDVVAGPYWYRGPDFTEKHGFFPAQPFETAPGPTNSLYSFVYDFNRDGWPDILVVGRVHLHPAFWYENPRSKSGLWPKHLVFERVQGETPAFGDVDRDGMPELLTLWENRWGFLRPDRRDPTQPWSYQPVTAPGPWQRFYHGEGLGDINGDGRVDLVLNDGWWEQPAGGQSAWPAHPGVFSKDRGGAQILVYDVNGDGRNDVITALNGHGWGLAWFEQIKDGSGIAFRQHKIMGDRREEAQYGVAFSQPHALALGDIDGDGLQDIVVGKRLWAHGPQGDVEPGGPPVVYWFQLRRGANGSVKYIPHLVDDRSGVGCQVVVTDVSGDGRPDILTVSKLGTFVFINRAAAKQPAAEASAGGVPQASARQWQVTELTFRAAADHPDPFDFARAGFLAEFRGPAGQTLKIPGYWDGGRTWKVRFTPTAPGVWTYQTTFGGGEDPGLSQQQGVLDVTPASGRNPVRQHGGFLRVSANGRYLTYADGTPFFWLGDTWWAFPSSNVPAEVFRQMVDRRVAQGFTVFQAHGHRSIFEPGPGAFEAVRQPTAETLRYWRAVDQCMAYAEQKGMLGVIGFGGHSLLDPISLVDLQRLWRYYIARYGAYPVTFLITQEYNADIGNLKERLPKLLALGRFIHETDPYRRAMSVHPWCLSRDKREAWSEPWLDFIMLQAGHRWFPGAKRYTDIYFGPATKPFVESEANYEGFEDARFRVDAACIRRTAYSAIQSGSFGFTYGAQGLYAGILRKDKPATTGRWGPVLTWKEGLDLPGGAQLQHLRAAYESVDWWRLAPRPGAVPGAEVLVKADGNRTFVLYFLATGKTPTACSLANVPAGARYTGAWFDPRTGRKQPLATSIAAQSEQLLLPNRPDQDDWLLILNAVDPSPAK
jgi:hypothetical protein